MDVRLADNVNVVCDYQVDDADEKEPGMIRNETEYQQARARIDAERRRFIAHGDAWKKQGFNDQQIAKLKEPLESFHMQLVEEVESYERLKRGGR
jgi:hypothetical protein